jgi:tetratricopeptide (TPR) repeat protein
MANDSPNQPDQSNGRRDLFLSYNSRDRAAVIHVRRLLLERNISTSFDRDQLSAGSRWVSLLENEVGRSRAVAVFIGPHGLGDWQEMEMQLALVRQIDEKKASRPFPVIPLILPGARPEKELGFLKLYTWVDLRARLDDPAAIDELESAVRGKATAQLTEAAVELCPYRALQAFREQDEKLFFGRERFAEQLLAKARDEKLKLIAVVGPSGSGKSSVVQAGLLPRLRRERPPRLSWEAAIFTPGKAPFHNLAAALVTAGATEHDRWERLSKAEKLGQDLSGGAIRLEAAIATAVDEAHGTNRLLLVVDQAEDLFTLTTEEDRKPFIQRLLAAADAAPVTIALTLRADFYDQAIGYSRELGELITEGQVNILPMSREELRQAIVAPANSVELKFEDGMVDRILDHIEDEPGNLPLLEFALTELWNRRQGEMLSNDAYEKIGGVAGAISRRAEEEFNRLSSEQQVTAQRVLTRLVRVAAATEGGTDTRQRVRLSELDASAREVALTFADARLLVTNRIEIKNEETSAEESEEIVEVAHEALIRSWQRLKDLLNRDRQFLLWRQRLGIALSEWQRTGRDADALLRGVLLNEARRWRKERGQDLNEREQEFIARSESAERPPKHRIAAAAAIVIVIALAAFGWKLWDNRPQSQINKILAQSPSVVKAAAANSFFASFDSTISAWLSALVLTGRSDDALDAARMIEDVGSRSLALAGIVEALAKAGKTEEMKLAATEALNAARMIGRADSRSQALASAVEALTKAGKTEEMKLAATEALDAARKIESAYSRSEALVSVVEALAKAGKTEEVKLAATEALNAARMIEPADSRSQALAKTIEALAKAGKTEEAIAATRMIEGAYSRSQALASAVEALAKAGKTEEMRVVAKEAIDAARMTEDVGYRSRTLASVAEALAKAGKTEEAIAAARKIEGAYSRSRALASAVEALAKAGKTEAMRLAATEALDAARMTEDAYSRSEALVSVADALSKAGKTDEAIEAARMIERADSRTLALASIVQALAKAGKTEEMKLAATEAFNAARMIEDVFYRSPALAGIVEALAKAGKTEEMKLAATEALNAARMIEPADSRSQALASAVEALAKAGKTEEMKLAATEALNAARMIEPADSRSQALASAVEALAKTGKTEEAIDAARMIEDINYRYWKLVSIVELLAKRRETADKARNVIEVAKQTAEQITKEEDKSKALAYVATGMAKLYLYRQARELVDLNNTLASDKLAAYTAILCEYHIQRYPDQAKLFGKEQKED